MKIPLGLSLIAGPGIARADEPSARWPHVDVSVSRVIGLPRLEMRSRDDWGAVGCVLPCALRLDPAAAYRISGEGVVDSNPFRLPVGADRVRVDVVPASTMARDMGSLLAVGGLVFVAGGGAVLLLPAGSAPEDQKASKTIVGVGMLSAGAVAAALGIVLRILSDTQVSVSPVATTAEAP